MAQCFKIAVEFRCVHYSVICKSTKQLIKQWRSRRCHIPWFGSHQLIHVLISPVASDIMRIPLKRLRYNAPDAGKNKVKSSK